MSGRTKADLLEEISELKSQRTGLQTAYSTCRAAVDAAEAAKHVAEAARRAAEERLEARNARVIELEEKALEATGREAKLSADLKKCEIELTRERLKTRAMSALIRGLRGTLKLVEHEAKNQTTSSWIELARTAALGLVAAGGLYGYLRRSKSRPGPAPALPSAAEAREAVAHGAGVKPPAGGGAL